MFCLRLGERDVASWKGGGRCLSPFALDLWAPDKLKKIIEIYGKEGTNSWPVYRLHQG